VRDDHDDLRRRSSTACGRGLPGRLGRGHEPLGNRIRKAKLEKLPYVLVGRRRRRRLHGTVGVNPRGARSSATAYVGVNQGRGSGAGVPDHLHVHVLPRWAGDTNFMTTVAETRVLPEALDATWAKIRAAWPRASDGDTSDGTPRPEH
jgi:hypothetical protein